MYTRLYNTPDVIDSWDVLNAQIIFQSTVNLWYIRIWGKNLMDDDNKQVLILLILLLVNLEMISLWTQEWLELLLVQVSKKNNI